MSEYEMVISAISSVGFPIVACCFMGWFCVQMQNILKELTVAINTLTTKFDDHIERIEGVEKK